MSSMEVVNAYDSPEQVLDDIVNSEQQFHFLKVKDVVDLEEDVNEELKRAREHFSKLKSCYIHLETRQGILHNVVKQNALDSFTPEAIKDLEIQVEQGKKQIIAVRTEIENTKKQLHDAITGLSEQRTQYQKEVDKLDNIYNKENSLEYRVDMPKVFASNASSSQYGCSEVSLLEQDSTEKCNALLENQINVIRELTTEIETLQTKVEELQGQNSPLEMRVKTLQATSNTYKKQGLNTPQEVKEMEKQDLWYRSVVTILSKLSGVSVLEQDEKTTGSNVIEIEFNPDFFPCPVEGSQYKLQVKYGNDFHTIINLALFCNGACTESEMFSNEVHSLLEDANTSEEQPGQILSFLVREIQALLMNFDF